MVGELFLRLWEPAIRAGVLTDFVSHSLVGATGQALLMEAVSSCN